MATWNEVADQRAPYRVLTPQSVAWWFALALLGDAFGVERTMVEYCLRQAAEIAEQRGRKEGADGT